MKRKVKTYLKSTESQMFSDQGFLTVVRFRSFLQKGRTVLLGVWYFYNANYQHRRLLCWASF